MSISLPYLIGAIFVMALVTYLTRAVPLTLFRKEIKNPYIRAFLEYIPYAVLGAMTLPDILFSTASVWSAVCGLVLAVFLAYRGRSLLTVAISACGIVFVAERIFEYFNFF